MTAALDIQISVEEGDWPEEEALLAFCAPVLEAAAAYLAAEEKQPLPKTPPELSLVLDVQIGWGGGGGRGDGHVRKGGGEGYVG